MWRDISIALIGSACALRQRAHSQQHSSADHHPGGMSQLSGLVVHLIQGAMSTAEYPEEQCAPPDCVSDTMEGHACMMRCSVAGRVKLTELAESADDKISQLLA